MCVAIKCIKSSSNGDGNSNSGNNGNNSSSNSNSYSSDNSNNNNNSIGNKESSTIKTNRLSRDRKDKNRVEGDGGDKLYGSIRDMGE